MSASPPRATRAAGSDGSAGGSPGSRKRDGSEARLVAVDYFTRALEDAAPTPQPPRRDAGADDERQRVAASSKLLDAVGQLKAVERRSVAGNLKLRHFDSADWFSGGEPGRGAAAAEGAAKRRSGESGSPGPPPTER